MGVNTGAVKNPQLTELMEIFGKQCIVAAIDAKRIILIQKMSQAFGKTAKPFGTKFLLWKKIYRHRCSLAKKAF